MRKLPLALLAVVALAGSVSARAADMRPPAAEAGPTALDPTRQRALYLGIIESLRREGSARAALAHLDSYDRMQPHDPRAQILRAECLADVGDSVAAEALYRKAAGGPYAARAASGLGHLLAVRREWTGAVQAFADAVKLKPTEVSYLNDLGFALIQTGKRDEGLFRLRQGLELAPGDVLLRNNLIVALQTAGRAGEAEGLVQTIKSPVERRAAQSVLETAAETASAAAQGEAQ